MFKHILATALLILAAGTPTTAAQRDCPKAGEWEVLSIPGSNRSSSGFVTNFYYTSGGFTEDYSIIATDRVCGEVNKLTYSTGAVRFTASILGNTAIETYRTKKAAEQYVETQCDPNRYVYPGSGITYTAPAFNTTTLNSTIIN